MRLQTQCLGSSGLLSAAGSMSMLFEEGAVL